MKPIVRFRSAIRRFSLVCCEISYVTETGVRPPAACPASMWEGFAGMRRIERRRRIDRGTISI
jgi:hypothetical protein